MVRDSRGKPVLATFFTAALWKDDMLSAAAVSELVEQRRAEDPYYLTSRTFAMGSLLTEGDHLYLDRNANWKGALDVLMAAVAEHAEAEGATTIVLRDLYGSDLELADALRERGYVAVRMLDSLVLEPVDADDEAWLARLPGKARWHQRRHVLPWDGAFDVEFVRKGDRELVATTSSTTSTSSTSASPARAWTSTRSGCRARCCATCSSTSPGS